MGGKGPWFIFCKGVEMILLYSTFTSKKEAEKISLALLSGKLAACATIFPSKSIYVWKGKTIKQKEFIALFKTNSKNAPEAKALIKRLHSYDIHCIIEFRGMANIGFE